MIGTAHRFDVAKLQRDLDARGWLATDLARASGLSNKTIHLVLKAQRFNPRTWDRLAKAMGYTIRRYLPPVAGKVA